MRWFLPVVVIGWAVGLWVGLTAAFPVGVTAQDVRSEAESIRAADPNLAPETAVQAATEYLQREQRRRLTYLFAAYLTVWAVFAAYLFWLTGRQKQLEAELARLQEQVRATAAKQ